jgi:hypothetical protein
MPARSIRHRAWPHALSGIAHVIGLPAATVSRSSPGARNPLKGRPVHFWACAFDICAPTPDLFVNR